MNKALRYVLHSLMLVLLIATGAVGVFAQEATEQPEQTEATVVGDSNSEALQAVRQYLEAQDTDVLAEDVTYFDRTLPQPITGRDAYLTANVGYYGTNFTDFFYTPSRYIVAENIVVVEFDYRGIRAVPLTDAEMQGQVEPLTGSDTVTGADGIAEPAPITAIDPVTGLPMMTGDVSVPMVGIFEAEGGSIQRIDMFYDAAALQYQLGYNAYFDPYYDTAYPAQGVGVGAPMAGNLGGMMNLGVGEITTDIGRYTGETVIVQGAVGAALSDNSFLLTDEGLTGLGGEQLLVVDQSEGGLQFIQMADVSVLVSGTMQYAPRADVTSQYGVTLDETHFTGVESIPVLLADRAVNAHDVATLGNIVNDPAAFYEQTISISGNLVDHVGTNAFVMDDSGLLGLNPTRLLVIVPDTADGSMMLPETGRNVVVTGTVRQFTQAEFQSEYTLDPSFDLSQYEMTPVIVADSIIPW